MTKKTSISQEIVSLVSQLLENLQVEGKVLVKEEKNGEETTYRVEVETAETGLLIGRYGETINSLQLIVGLMLFKKLGSWQRVIFDVGGYRKNREEFLRQLVERALAEVETTKQPVTLPYLSPLERRFVHLLLAQNEKFTSQSVGEGRERRLTIRPR